MAATIRLDRAEGVGTLTLCRPARLNALDPALAADLLAACEGMAEDRELGCVVIEGAGGNFMAGGDVHYFASALESGAFERDIFDCVHRAVRCLREMDKPVIAGIDGACAGFGISLVAACDLALAAADAQFALAYRQLGVSPDGGATWLLPRTLGLKRAAELVLLGERFGAEQALQMGLVNRVVAPERRTAETRELALRLSRGPRQAQARAKSLLNRSLGSDFDSQLRAEEEAFLACAGEADFAEGVRAFIEKRAARFGGP